MCDCLDYPLVLMAQDMELRIMVDHIDARLQGQGRPMVETNSVAMVRRLVARGKAVGFQIPDTCCGCSRSPTEATTTK